MSRHSVWPGFSILSLSDVKLFEIINTERFAKTCEPEINQKAMKLSSETLISTQALEILQVCVWRWVSHK
jgi:hypothetical protein